KAPEIGRFLGSDVVLLSRICCKVVSLGSGRMDVLKSCRLERREIAPPEVIARKQSLAVERAVVRDRLLPQQREPGELCGRRRKFQQTRQGGKHIDEAGRSRDSLAVAAATGQLDDQRNPNRLPVEKEAVLVLPMVAEAFAMIRKQHDDRVLIQRAAL